MKKIAILIMAHEFNIQQKYLVDRLKDSFDIYIHFDKKSDLNIYEIKDKYKDCKILCEYNVFWGGENMVLATLSLLKCAIKKKHERYILISGQDLPIRSNEYIERFYKNNIYDYFEIHKLPRMNTWGKSGGLNRLYYYYSNQYSNNKTMVKIINKISVSVYKLIRAKRKILNIDYYGGSQWFSITDNTACEIVKYCNNNKKYLDNFKYSLCCDEIFFQTLIMNFINDVNIYPDNNTYIDWIEGNSSPLLLNIDCIYKEYEEHILFARKFNITSECIINEFNKRLQCETKS